MRLFQRGEQVEQELANTGCLLTYWHLESSVHQNKEKQLTSIAFSQPTAGRENLSLSVPFSRLPLVPFLP